jgi:hypothetical protein
MTHCCCLPPQVPALVGLVLPEIGPRNAIIGIELIGPPTGGTWRLTLRSPLINPATGGPAVETFAELAWNLTAAQLTALLEASTHFAAGVLVTGGAAHQAPFVLEFIEDLGHLPVPLPSPDWFDLEGGLGADAYHIQYGLPEPPP